MRRVSTCKQDAMVELLVLLTRFLFSRYGGGRAEIIICARGVARQARRAVQRILGVILNFFPYHNLNI